MKYFNVNKCSWPNINLPVCMFSQFICLLNVNVAHGIMCGYDSRAFRLVLLFRLTICLFLLLSLCLCSNWKTLFISINDVTCENMILVCVCVCERMRYIMKNERKYESNANRLIKLNVYGIRYCIVLCAMCVYVYQPHTGHVSLIWLSCRLLMNGRVWYQSTFFPCKWINALSICSYK